MAADTELVALYWTVSGPVEVHVGREWSLFDWADRCAEARKVGFSGIGIWHADLEHVLETRSLAEMKKVFDDNGLRHLELEFIMDWFVDPGDPRREASDEIRELLIRAAAEFGAHHIKVGNIPGTACELPRADGALRRAVRGRGRAHRCEGRVRVHALRRNREVDRHGGRGGRGSRRAQRRHRHRHLAHEQARDRAGRAAPDPAGVPLVDRAERRPVREHGRSRSTRSSTTATCRARASSTCLRTLRSARTAATRGPGASRCCPRSCATTRST